MTNLRSRNDSVSWLGSCRFSCQLHSHHLVWLALGGFRFTFPVPGHFFWKKSNGKIQATETQSGLHNFAIFTRAKSGALRQCFGETEKEGKREKEKRGKRKFEIFLFLKVAFDFLFFCLKDKLKLIDFWHQNRYFDNHLLHYFLCFALLISSGLSHVSPLIARCAGPVYEGERPLSFSLSIFLLCFCRYSSSHSIIWFPVHISRFSNNQLVLFLGILKFYLYLFHYFLFRKFIHFWDLKVHELFR